MSVQYLLDENLPLHWRKSLARRAPTLVVRRVGDPGSPALQSPDPVILEWCDANGFILVTNNHHSMPGHLLEHLAGGGHVPGIFVVTPNLTSAGCSLS